VSLPIVYLSTETDLGCQLSALRMGGDDFLTKPLTDPHLVAAVEIRAQRNRDLRALMTRDSLTELLNHVALKDRLAVELARSQRKGDKLAFVMLDIDEFKRVNDRFGHLAGDRVLRILAELLRQRVRMSDTVGRYGGEEFGIILPDCSIEDAARVIDKLRESFGDIRFGFDEERCRVTFSAGVAVAEPGMSVDDLIDRADQALYLAKREGRNRVRAADS
jgi:diguanylate cyclase (GGDEF)-like protein